MRYRNLLKVLGPGIIFASMAIGVSHLVQSTRAGALFGFSLLLLVLATNILKYPFFEYASRYANATGESLIDGYARLGRPVLWAYFLMTVVTMFGVMAAVGVVTAGFFDNLLGVGNLVLVTVVLFVLGVSVLILGQYKTLDSLIKVVSVVLLISTVIAFLFALYHGPQARGVDLFPPVHWQDQKTVLFLLALMGWMPTAVDLSTWTSLWAVERMKETDYHPSLRESLFDFNLGYGMTIVLALCFVVLGAYLMYGTGVKPAASSPVFANQVVQMYTHTIGQWSYWIVAASAFSIMFGTSISVMDGYSRVLERASELLFLSPEKAKAALGDNKFYNASLVILAVGAFALIYFMVFRSTDPKGFKRLVDWVTTISFLIAPFVAVINYILVTRSAFPESHRPGLWLRILSWLGMLFLTGFSLYFIWLKLRA